MKIRIDWVAILGWFLLLTLFALWVTSCNPVKKVLKDRKMFDQVAKEVVKAGYCANDTIILTESDTTLMVDTITLIEDKFTVDVVNDTTYITKYKIKFVTKTVNIRDTIKRVVIDNAKVQILEKELISAKFIADEWKEKAHRSFGWLIIVFIGIGAYLYLKYKK